MEATYVGTVREAQAQWRAASNYDRARWNGRGEYAW